jgi:ankyrin repeat protein
MTEQFFEAIQKGDGDRVSELVDADPALTQARTPNGVSPVLLAMYNGRTEIARSLVERGLEMDVFEASAVGAFDRVRDLAGRDPSLVNAVSPDGFQPLGLACFFGHPKVAEFLVLHGADVNAAARNTMQVRPLHAAVARRSAATVRMLLERGADPNVRQQAGYTPLHAAAKHGDREIVELLLAHGADPSAKSDAGQDAAGFAAEAGHPALADLLAT